MSYDAPNELCEALKRVFEQHGPAIDGALDRLEEVQFARFTSTMPDEAKQREDVYFSVLGAREFHAYLKLLAAQAKSNAENPAPLDHHQV